MRRRIKALFLTEGGRGIGFGHVTRCIALSEALKERGGVDARFMIRGDSSISALLPSSDYLCLNWLAKKGRVIHAAKTADIAIIDSYLAKLNFYQWLHSFQRNLVCLDDSNRLDYPGGVVINGSIYAKNLGFTKETSKNYLLGTDFTLVRREFWNVPSKRINKNIKSIMLTLGGEDMRRIAPIILSFLTARYPGAIKNIIIGRGFRNLRAIKGAADKCTKLIFCPDAEAMKLTMLNSDIAISSGGQSLYELARIGLPTIAVCLAENQKENIEGWQKKGFIFYAGWYNDRNLLQKIEKGISYLDSQEIRLRISRFSRGTIDGNGPRRAADFILRTLIKE